MHTEFLIDLAPLSGKVWIDIVAEAALPPELVDFLETKIRGAATLVTAQGLSSGAAARLDVLRFGVSAAGRTLQVELDGQSVPPSVWRIMAGMLSAFDMASATLTELRFRQDGHAGPSSTLDDVLSVPYPPPIVVSFPLNRRPRQREAASLEIELIDVVADVVRDELVVALNAWLRTCLGGFFQDGLPPITGAHDCPRIDETAPTLLVARMDIWTGNDAAFDAALRLLDAVHRRQPCIREVKLY